MRKDELIHVHGLLGSVAEELLARGAATPADLEPYGECEVGPLSLRARRAEHERAVLLLVALLADAAARERATAQGTESTAPGPTVDGGTTEEADAGTGDPPAR